MGTTRHKEVEAKRHLLVAEAQYLIARASQIDYIEQRPMPMNGFHTWGDVVHQLSRDGRMADDCSGSITNLYRWAKCEDPCNMNFDGYGNTDSMFNANEHYTETRHAHPGAIGIFGWQGATVHAIMVMQPDGDNPWCYSHGEEAGPFHIRLLDEQRYHTGQPLAWLNVAHLL